jgi:hypothetical protein
MERIPRSKATHPRGLGSCRTKKRPLGWICCVPACGIHTWLVRHTSGSPPTGSTLTKGELVYMNLRSCHSLLVRRHAPFGGQWCSGRRPADARLAADRDRPLPAEVKTAR